MTDPFDLATELPGGVLRRGDTGGSRAARLRIGPEGIVATLENGEAVELSWRGVRLRENPDGDGVYCTSRDGAVTVHSAHPDFLRALEAAGGNDLNDALSRLAGERVSSRTRHRVGCAVVLALIALAIWGVPRLFHGAVDATVSALPYSVDEKIGESVYDQMDLGGPEVDDPLLREAIQAMIDRLEPHSLIPGAKFQFKLVENEQVNAFALPGGYMVVFTGLMAEADRPEEVAGVIAHEMAHVTRRHGLRRIAHSIGVWAGISIVLGDLDTLSGIAVQLFTLSRINDYSQFQETDADLEGTRMMVAARLDPGGLQDFFGRLEETVGDVPASLAWLSTHPMHRERIAAVQAYVDENAAGVEWAPLDVDWEAVRARLAE